MMAYRFTTSGIEPFFDLGTQLAKHAAFLFGVSLHIFLFRIGEWDLETIRIIGVFGFVQIASVAVLIHFFPTEYPSAFDAAPIIVGLTGYVILGIYSSMLVYRGFLHRLHRFPGPFLARFSNIYITRLAAKNLQLYEEVQRLHQKYGDIVRVGPSEISINDPRAVGILHSAQTTCGKGPWYNVLHPLVSLQMIRHKPDHIRRRKVWDRGFSAKALRDYEPRVVGHAVGLLAHLKKTEGTPVDVTDWFNFYSFDVMGDLAWGKSFEMTREGVKHYFMTSLHASMTSIGLFSHMIWFFPIFKSTPVLNSEYKRFWAWAGARVQERRMTNPERPDVFSWLLEAHNSLEKPTAQDELNLIGDAYLIAVAGSDTTAATLSCLFFELCRNPRCLQLLQEEIDGLFDAQKDVEMRSLAQLPYLEATINEALRLHPPVPSGVQRMSPPEGLSIGETFIPGNTIIQIPTYTMFRDARIFEKPDDFIPERWTTQKELTKDASAFVPFSTGRYSCIGKQLGLMEIRYVTSQILRCWDTALAPGQTPQAFLHGKKDTFTQSLSALNLVFTPREGNRDIKQPSV